jgi:hypothetical protein
MPPPHDPSACAQGMAAGENTLNALCARVVMRGITDNGGRCGRAPLAWSPGASLIVPFGGTA